MDNKEDWEEIEKWNNTKQMETEEKYGIDINNVEGEEKKVDKFAKVLGIVVKTIYFIGKGAVLLAIFIAFMWVIFTFTGVHELLGT